MELLIKFIRLMNNNLLEKTLFKSIITSELILFLSKKF